MTSELGAYRVTVGIPTYNRAELLGRSIESVLSQDQDSIELVISDNASTDATRSLCEGYARRNPSIRYLRQPENMGAVRNFVSVLEQARGRHFMWLGDDDWIERSYVRRCLETLERDPSFVVVGGLASYYHPGGTIPVFDDTAITLKQDSPGERCLSYLALVTANGLFYGLMRRDTIRRVGFVEGLGGDWTMLAALCLLGKVATLGDVRIHRSLGGASNARKVAIMAGLGRIHRPEGLFPAVGAYHVASAIRRGASIFGMLSRRRRSRLASEAAWVLLARHYDWQGIRSVFQVRTRWRDLLSRLGFARA